jgi:hypothetical protein
MNKIGYIVVIAIFLFFTVFVLRDIVLYEPILNHFHKEIERKWGCKIVRKATDFDLKKGSLRVKDVSMMTHREVFLEWNLRATEIFIQVDYFSLFGRNIILKKLVLDKMSFKQEYIEALDIEKKAMSRAVSEKGDKKEQTQREKDTSERTVLVRNLLIKDGSFEFNYLKNSGKKGRFRAQHVNLSKKDVFINSKPTEFFLSLFEGIEGLRPSQ